MTETLSKGEGGVTENPRRQRERQRHRKRGGQRERGRDRERAAERERGRVETNRQDRMKEYIIICDNKYKAIALSVEPLR